MATKRNILLLLVASIAVLLAILSFAKAAEVENDYQMESEYEMDRRAYEIARRRAEELEMENAVPRIATGFRARLLSRCRGRGGYYGGYYGGCGGYYGCGGYGYYGW